MHPNAFTSATFAEAFVSPRGRGNVRIQLEFSALAAADIYLYSVEFHGMKLAGVVLSMVGFCLVLLPENWPDYLQGHLDGGKTNIPVRQRPRIPNPEPATHPDLGRQSGRVK
ncbi:solute carrier family 35 member F4 [Caerostris extrusa]|uniref:Solute carrier family 35 member F4 n=1 Tax=Caerostris extrusa TaxID=172846 RepID=A0AAV4P3E2_CAEEX|nr:solute carrier family 35 member F4 [Caerostris extrusa]